MRPPLLAYEIEAPDGRRTPLTDDCDAFMRACFAGSNLGRRRVGRLGFRRFAVFNNGVPALRCFYYQDLEPKYVAGWPPAEFANPRLVRGQSVGEWEQLFAVLRAALARYERTWEEIDLFVVWPTNAAADVRYLERRLGVAAEDFR